MLSNIYSKSGRIDDSHAIVTQFNPNRTTLSAKVAFALSRYLPSYEIKVNTPNCSCFSTDHTNLHRLYLSSNLGGFCIPF